MRNKKFYFIPALLLLVPVSVFFTQCTKTTTKTITNTNYIPTPANGFFNAQLSPSSTTITYGTNTTTLKFALTIDTAVNISGQTFTIDLVSGDTRKAQDSILQFYSQPGSAQQSSDTINNGLKTLQGAFFPAFLVSKKAGPFDSLLYIARNIAQQQPLVITILISSINSSGEVNAQQTLSYTINPPIPFSVKLLSTLSLSANPGFWYPGFRNDNLGQDTLSIYDPATGSVGLISSGALTRISIDTLGFAGQTPFTISVNNSNGDSLTQVYNLDPELNYPPIADRIDTLVYNSNNPKYASAYINNARIGVNTADTLSYLATTKTGTIAQSLIITNAQGQSQVVNLANLIVVPKVQ